MRHWILSLAAVALIAGTSFAGKYNKVVSVGDKSPAITGIPAVSETGDKELTLDLNNAKEDVVVVAFLANHCPAVIACEDRLYDLVKAYNGKSVKFIGVCSSGPQMADEDGIAAIKDKIKQGKYNLTYGYDEDGKIGKAFGATNTPQFFVLDKDRTIRYTGRMDDGAESKGPKAYLKTAIDAVLAGETVEETETRAIGCGIPYKR
ncbi:redoxin family protein [Tundrisphaera lichenicola]|uniref:redoxin family protein n=1 Tax=Tundrisphaera lichenicola TaxID=2029860 RepID=UPI003EB8358D